MSQFFTLSQIFKVGRSTDGWIATYFFAEILERCASSIISDGKIVGITHSQNCGSYWNTNTWDFGRKKYIKLLFGRFSPKYFRCNRTDSSFTFYDTPANIRLCSIGFPNYNCKKFFGGQMFTLLKILMYIIKKVIFQKI